MSSVPCRTALRCFDSFGIEDALPSMRPMVAIRLSIRQDMCCEMTRTDGMSSTCLFWDTTADENELGYQRRRRMWSSALVAPESPRMSLTLDAVENNGLSPSLRRGAREGDFRDLCILTSHGGRRQSWKFCIRGAVGWMCTSPPSLLVF